MDPEDQDPSDYATACIASELQLEAFCVKAVEDRVLTPALRGVLAETALTGVVRYKWALVRPLVEFAMEEVGESDRHEMMTCTLMHTHKQCSHACMHAYMSHVIRHATCHT